MDSNEVDRVVAALRAGQAYSVPFDTTLGPETQALESVLRALVEGGFELTTAFREHAPGHGWSLEQYETEPRTEAQVRDSLGRAALDAVTPV